MGLKVRAAPIIGIFCIKRTKGPMQKIYKCNRPLNFVPGQPPLFG
jgi:hypothetical protein